MEISSPNKLQYKIKTYLYRLQQVEGRLLQKTVYLISEEAAELSHGLEFLISMYPRKVATTIFSNVSSKLFSKSYNKETWYYELIQ